MTFQAIAGTYRLALQKRITAMYHGGVSRGKALITLQDREMSRTSQGLSYREIQSIVDKVYNKLLTQETNGV